MILRPLPGRIAERSTSAFGVTLEERPGVIGEVDAWLIARNDLAGATCR
jgi:hypothetical protein